MSDSKALENIDCFARPISILSSSSSWPHCDYPLGNLLLSLSVLLSRSGLFPSHRARPTV